MTTTRKTVILTEGTPWKCILRFAVPLFFGSLLQQLYYTVDAMMVGNLISEAALSGVGTCGVLTNLLIAFSTGFSAGSSVISAQFYGAGREQDIPRNAKASLTILVLLGLIIGGIGFAFGTPLLRHAVSVPESLIGYASEYFRICAFGFLFQFLYNGVAALLRSIGDSRASLYFLLISSFANVGLDYIFIRFCNMGVAGAAWATVISQFASCAAAFAYMYRKYEMFRIFGRKIRVGISDVVLILKTGFPIALQSMVGTVFNLFVQRLVNSFGDAMTASYAVVSQVEGYMHLPTNTLNQAIPTYTAQNIGAKKPERLRQGLRHTVIMAMSFTAVLSVLSFAFAPQIAGGFGISGVSAEYCTMHIRCLAFPFLIFAWYFPCTGMYQGAGKGMAATAMSTTFLALCLTFGYGLQYIPAIGHASLWICKPLAWMIVAPINYIYYFKGNWKNAKIINS